MTKIHPPERSSPAEKKGITMKDTALAFIKKYPYAVSFGEINFGPLAEQPRIEIENRLKESHIWENHGIDAVYQQLEENQAEIVIRTKNIETCLTLISQFRRSMHINAPDKRKELRFTPITENENEKELIFPVAILLPDMEYVPTYGGDHLITLYFRAYPDNSGILFRYE